MRIPDGSPTHSANSAASATADGSNRPPNSCSALTAGQRWVRVRARSALSPYSWLISGGECPRRGASDSDHRPDAILS